MESSAEFQEEIKRLRCRLCFHAGNNCQLVEVFNKHQDISKRVISALGVKINRSEKQAKICTICETLIDIIQSFQAVCKQTNQLHHDRKDFILYDTFWTSQEQNAVKITEKMILTHRSEVDKTISGTIVIPVSEKNEIERPVNIVTGEKHVSEPTAVKNEQCELLKPEMVLCESPVKDESCQNEPVLSVEKLQSELNEPIARYNDEEVDDSDFKYDEYASTFSDDPEIDCDSKKSMPKGRRKKVHSKSSLEDEFMQKANESREDKVPRQRRRKSHYTIEYEPSDDEREPKIPGKRGPRRKKIRKSDPSVCDICGQTVAHFVKESHRNQHLGVRPYKCDYEGCGRSYFSQNDLRTHNKRHQITYHVCEICGRNIKGVEWFRRHVKTHTEGPQFTCEACGSKFRRKAQLQTHMVTHTGLTPHECKICGKRFALKYNLDSHIKRHEKKEGTEKYEDKKDTAEKRTWKYYVKSDNSGEKHHVTCETCGKLVHKREIEGHVNKHLDRRPYSCDEAGCTLAFYGLRGIKEHKMVVHSDKILRYECSICNRSIKGAGTFKRHVMMHNSDMKVECQYCGKKFTSKSYLKAHEQKHSGERPYVCEICGRSFAMKPCWKMHMKTVHNQDRRELTRVRKNGPTETTEQHAVVVHNESLLPEQPLSLNPPISDQQQAPTIIPVISHYPATNSVRTDYSY
ncbi:zinc finger protein 718-like [Topomyia yanbarensis]|uniref:zinc finger protein 718-like n=1 Tax=Topomyia yanbarensis TaxID=2498891 RepID=UPI00273CBED1|nr:zinc finger protein 718-like [Topomyia yanbarensis]